MTSLRVLWLGTPAANGSKRRRKSWCICPQRLISTKSSAPANVPHNTKSKTSGNGNSTFQNWRGSSNAANCSISDGPDIGKPPQQEVSHESDFKPCRKPSAVQAIALDDEGSVKNLGRYAASWISC